MFRNYFFINIILILIVSFLGLRFYKAIIYKKYNPVNITVKKSEPENIKTAGEDIVIDRESLKVITEKDIFRSSRTSSLPGANNRPLKNPPTLYGTIIVGAEKTALLREDDGKAAKMYRLKDSISGYLIVDIQNDKVLLEAGGQTIEVKLRGKKSANPQLTSGTPAQRPRAVTPSQRPQEAGPRRRVRPSPQRPSRTETNIQAPAPTAPVPVPPMVTQPVPVPASPEQAPEPVPIPEPMEEMEGSPDDIQQ